APRSMQKRRCRASRGLPFAPPQDDGRTKHEEHERRAPIIAGIGAHGAKRADAARRQPPVQRPRKTAGARARARIATAAHAAAHTADAARSRSAARAAHAARAIRNANALHAGVSGLALDVVARGRQAISLDADLAAGARELAE